MTKWHTIPFILLLFTLSILTTACDSGSSGTTDGDLDCEADTVTDGDHENEIELDDDVSEVSEDLENSETEEEPEEDAEQELVCNNPVPARELAYQPDEAFDFGPYLMQPMQTSIIVKWHTTEDADGTVYYGTTEELGLSASQNGTSTIHEVSLENLEPDTRYYYKVTSGGVTGNVHHFYTAPDPEQGFSAVMWGDSQSNPETFAKLVEHMAGLKPYLALGVGDHVSEGDEFYQWKERLFGPARGMFHEVGFYAAIGNHARNSQNWYDLMSFPHPEENPQHESFYSFTYGNAFFLVIDTDKPYFPFGDIDTEISQFVHEQVASPEAKAAKWRFAISHVPGYAEAWGDSVCESYGGDYAIRNWLYTLLNENNFHAHFAGHMHGYERGQSGNLFTFITGGGGGGLDAWCVDLPEVSVAQYIHHHLYLEIGCDTVKISAYDLEGNKFDWLEINQNYGEIVDEGPIENLPDPDVDPNSPTLNE